MTDIDIETFAEKDNRQGVHQCEQHQNGYQKKMSYNKTSKMNIFLYYLLYIFLKHNDVYTIFKAFGTAYTG